MTWHTKNDIEHDDDAVGNGKIDVRKFAIWGTNA